MGTLSKISNQMGLWQKNYEIRVLSAIVIVCLFTVSAILLSIKWGIDNT